MFPTLSLGPLVLPTAALATLLGVWLALTAVERAAKRLRLDPPPIYNLATLGIVTGLIGARLTFVALYWNAFQNNLLGIIWPLNSGYNWVGGVLIGGAAMLFYGRHKQLPLWSTLDALTPGILVLLMALSLADLLGGPGMGKPTSLPFGVEVFGTRRHVVQAYDLIAGAAALAVWWRIAGAAHSAESTFSGRPFLTAIGVYAFGRLLADSLRANGPVFEGPALAGIHIIQIAALAVLLVCLVILARKSLAAAAATATPESTV